MADPTEIVLSTGFLAAAGIFAGAMVIRESRMGKRVVETAEWGTDGGAEVVDPAPEGKWRVSVSIYEWRDLAGVGFIFVVFAGLILSSVSATRPADFKVEAGDLWMNIGFQFLMAGVISLLVIQRIGIVDWLGLRWRAWPAVVWIAPGAVLCMWLVFLVLQRFGYVEWMEALGVETVQDSVKMLQKERDPLLLGLMSFGAVVAAPLCEELVFRGYLYPVMKKFSGVWPAAVASALLFGCAHGSLTALLPLFLFGFLLVMIYERTGSLWAPISAHFAFNAVTVTYQMAIRLGWLPIESGT
jgi:membrane protease YdiL (CAAX protease family)